jgi:putative addiction module component (TIGR02574 family)
LAEGVLAWDAPAVTKAALDLATLTRDERLELLEALWDSLSRESEPLPLTEEQESELDRRLDSLDREGAVGLSPEELREHIRSRPS